MANIIDYLHWRGDLSFTQSGVNEVDNILFVFLSFLNFEGIVPNDPAEGDILLRDAVHLCFERTSDAPPYYGVIMPNKDIHRMARLMARSNRFGHVKITGYINEINTETEAQFSTYTALLDDGSIFISFKGTDDTLVGWKEDLNMSVSKEIPGQRHALEYLNKVAETFNGKIRIGGHSKGGNLAVYAAAKCHPSIQKRIVRVYNNDGPGFSAEFIESEGYQNIKPKILKLIPQESIVGLLLTNDDHFSVVLSSKSGVFQHNSFLWEIRGRHFIRRPALAQKSIELSKTINTWINEKDEETRKEIIEALYEILTASDARTLTDISNNKTALLSSLKKIDPQKRELVFKTVTQLVGEIIKSGRQRKKTNNEEKSSQEIAVINNETNNDFIEKGEEK